MLTVMRYFNKTPVELSASHSDVAHIRNSAALKLKYHTEWYPSEVFFMTFGHKCISEQILVERFFCHTILDSRFLEVFECPHLIKSKKTS